MPDRNRYISMELVEHLADELETSPRMCKTVVLCGIGESTLHPELDQIVRKLSDTGVEVVMTTNGERMNTRRFEELVAQGLSGFNFSLNAATSETHRKVMRLKRFDQIMRNLQEIVEVRHKLYPHILLNVSFVVCNLNHHEVMDFVEFWRTKSISKIWLHPVNNRAGLLSEEARSVSMDMFERMYQSNELVTVDIFRNVAEEGNICKIASALIFLSADGEMRLCAMDYRRVTSYGILGQKSIREMHMEKLSGYARGEMTGFCSGCDFCPPRIKGVGQNSFLEDQRCSFPVSQVEG